MPLEMHAFNVRFGIEGFACQAVNYCCIFGLVGVHLGQVGVHKGD